MKESDIIRVRKRQGEKEKYVAPLLKGLGYTMKKFWSKPKTIQYPDQKREVSERWRGLHELTRNEAGELNCVACGLCAAICPAMAIDLTPYEEEGGIRYPKEFVIDELRCIFCGYCEEVCPKGAIKLSKIYDYADFSREAFRFDIEKLKDARQFRFREKKARYQYLLG